MTTPRSLNDLLFHALARNADALSFVPYWKEHYSTAFAKRLSKPIPGDWVVIGAALRNEDKRFGRLIQSPDPAGPMGEYGHWLIELPDGAPFWWVNVSVKPVIGPNEDSMDFSRGREKAEHEEWLKAALERHADVIAAGPTVQ